MNEPNIVLRGGKFYVADEMRNGVPFVSPSSPGFLSRQEAVENYRIVSERQRKQDEAQRINEKRARQARAAADAAAATQRAAAEQQQAQQNAKVDVPTAQATATPHPPHAKVESGE